MQRADHLNELLTNAPLTPGCYIYKNKEGKIIYVGKALVLRKRIKQYFKVENGEVIPSDKLEPRKQIMVGKIQDIEFVQTDTEVEALILEVNLIKKYKPYYNRLMVDDKSYGWIMITDKEDFPRILFVREKKVNGASYFGPFPSTFPVHSTLKNLRKVFPYRACRRTMHEEKDKSGKLNVICSDPKPCLYYHLDLCKAPCASLQSKKEYRKNINSIKKYLRGEKAGLVSQMEKQMHEYAKDQKYEKAKLLRDQINQLKYVSQRIRINEDIDEKKWREYRKKMKAESLSSLQLVLSKREIINNTNNLRRIECYDISNIQGTNAVGSMVVFIDGDKAKGHYRKFKIKFKNTPDDFEMMREVLRRRFAKKESKSKDISFNDKPDLIIIDGGKGQLSAALEVANELNLNMPIVGLAKREETFVWMRDGEFKEYKLKEGSNEKFLVQRIRDEAHRFAIKYHRNLRSKAQLQSKLDQIPGIGAKTKEKLLMEFGDVTTIRRAGRNRLMKVVNNKRTVENILKYL
ncbi:excinuclease ABC subunit UvrC [Candidatus Dojkabacteria bacterium]|uniref:Excinuclease ABC subunit UvrC n=1 Tax=Candidatus Dojkabacteria bacterium TaxID=2099670 RepID=A0A955L3T6_9BACT|nr:excinuclease ABC subunit UvrC [Candidatus Dojkabacteria bacterium]